MAPRFEISGRQRTRHSVRERPERLSGSEDCQDSLWRHRIRLLGNLVFGTRDIRVWNSLKSPADLSEKHQAVEPAETASRQELMGIAADLKFAQLASDNGDTYLYFVYLRR